MSEHRYLHCLYAEDVRPEMSGTFSVIGAFQGGVQLPSFPARLTKIAIVASLSFPAYARFDSLKLEVVLDGKVIQSVEPPSSFIEKSIQGADKHADLTQGKGFFIQLLISIVGVEVEKPGRIFTRAFIDGDLIEGNGLMLEPMAAKQ